MAKEYDRGKNGAATLPQTAAAEKEILIIFF